MICLHRFQAMGSPCEIQLEIDDPEKAIPYLQKAIQEVSRIEQKYSRYIDGNTLNQINQSAGSPVSVDDETARLLDYADHCFHMSGGLFDITTSAGQKVDWSRVTWNNPQLCLAIGNTIDLGGICKEYAADCLLAVLKESAASSILVNLGGDIAAWGQKIWSVGIEDPEHPGGIVQTIGLCQGGVATSGITKRAGHIIHPKTGAPIAGAPQSVTVAAQTCTEAGFWSTVAILQGHQAESFIEKQSLEAWCYRLS